MKDKIEFVIYLCKNDFYLINFFKQIISYLFLLYLYRELVTFSFIILGKEMDQGGVHVRNKRWTRFHYLL